jgi:hypothetical protein
MSAEGKPFGPLHARSPAEQIRYDEEQADAFAAKQGWPARTSDVVLGDVLVLSYGRDGQRQLTVRMPAGSRLTP